MTVKPLLIASLMLAVVMAVFAFVTAAHLPPGAELPTHWNAVGKVDATSPALRALLLPVGLVLFVAAIMALIPRLEPMQDRLDASAPVLQASWIGLLLLMVLIQATIGLPAWGLALPVKTVFVGSGLLLLIIGNALPKSRPGFFVGVRTPWAIMDTDNWIATHRLAGKLMMLAGASVVLVGILPFRAETTAIVMIAAVLASAVVPVIYSWWLWRQKQAGGTTE